MRDGNEAARADGVARVIPSPWTVGRRVWSQSGEDTHGNPVQAHAAPVPVPVRGVAPRLAEEPHQPGRWIVVDGFTVYADAGTQVGPYDIIVWPFAVDDAGAVVEYGDEYEVDGPLADWTCGPWANPVAGVTFDIVQVRG